MGIQISQLKSAWTGSGPKGHWFAALGPISLTAATKTEARESLIAVVEQAISGEWQPEHLAYGNHTALVYRDIQGWHYQFQEVGQRHCTTISSGTDGRTETISAAKKHLAQAAYPGSNGLAFLGNDYRAILDHLHWIGFQRAYQHAMSMTGVTEPKMHQYACEKANDPRWLNPDEIQALDDAQQGMRWSSQKVGAS